MLRFVMACVLWSGVTACQPTPSASERSETETTAPATSDSAATPAEKKPIHLPSQNQQASKGYAVPGVRPNEICMEKGFTYLYQGYLRPECGTCHNKANRYSVTEFAQGADEAASFAVLKTVTDSKKLLEAVLGNVFCKGCVITKDDPLYADLEYFVQHMDRCEKP
ncbi:MAG TPA: hypothetical protein VE954_24965 [Oligoflexus sp.]|uniref:hypothetical protein n=1 Tax=Oligoflexus sp. TaxID=1971216 RepID=UPI002D31D3F5|nr:hypothetical protein [Oligoflexus sp.]HYX36370.1 hypothetical protein [Oligoflexus sp.]